MQLRPLESNDGYEYMQGEGSGIVGVTTGEMWFYAAVILAGAAAGILRTWGDRNYQSVRGITSITGSSGVLAYCIVAFLCGRNGAGIGREFYFVAVAFAVGLAGKEQDKILKGLTEKLLSMIGIDTNGTDERDSLGVRQVDADIRDGGSVDDVCKKSDDH